MTSFKQFLTEASNRKEVDLDTAVQLYLENCKQWPDIKLALFRESDTAYEGPVVGSPRIRQEESLGDSEQIQRWMKTLPEWKSYPDRRKSTFCTTGKNSQTEGDFGWNVYRIIPFDNTALAIWPKDFNLFPIKINGRLYTLPRIQEEVNTYVGIFNLKYRSDFGSKLKALATVEPNDKQADGTAGAMIEFAQNTMKYLSPKVVGSILYQNPSQYKKPNTATEVWFSGKFLQIPEPQWQEFAQAVRKIQREQA